jgi:Mg-chelatase subunit ChlD
MRRLSIQFTSLLALIPALSLGCAMSPEDSSAVAYADEKVAMEPSYGGEAVESPGSYDFADDVRGEAEAPSDAAPTTAAPPSPSPAPSAAMEESGAGDGGRASASTPGGVGSASKGKMATSEGRRARDSDESSERSPSSPSKKSEAKIATDRPDRQIQSGTLTAGSFDDNLNPWVFDRFVEQVRSHPDLSQLASAFVGQRTVLRVQDTQGRPVGDAKVEIDGKQMRTGTDGKVVWVSGWDGGRQAQGKATISHGNSRKTINVKDQIEQLVTLEDARGVLPDALDIALVIDTTGSMGDEMEYLKVEMRDIAEAIEHHFPGVEQRFALVVYKDEGDQYVTQSFDFTSNLDSFQRNLGAESAGGGGDYPEAMDAAMEAATKLSWRNGDTARVTFLVADAPPHANDFDDTFEAVDELREMGVAVYPVASSGVAGEAEFAMRTTAMLTGGEYLFLTDDSGVGNPHAEPHIPCYTVEQLAPLMVRAVRSELSGHRVEAEPQFSIRTVGQGQGGVCEQPRANKTKIAK